MSDDVTAQVPPSRRIDRGERWRRDGGRREGKMEVEGE